MNFHLFTPPEANAALSELTSLIRQVNTRRQDLIYLHVELEGLRSQLGHNQPDAMLQRRIVEKEAEINAIRKELRDLAQTVDGMGCILRDYERGLVDFPAIIEQQPAYLCWRMGEESVQFWHGPEDGFAGRKPLGNVSERET